MMVLQLVRVKMHHWHVQVLLSTATMNWWMNWLTQMTTTPRQVKSLYRICDLFNLLVSIVTILCWLGDRMGVSSPACNDVYPKHWVVIISITAEWNDCVSFQILQEYDNLRKGTVGRTVIGRNGTLILTYA